MSRVFFAGAETGHVHAEGVTPSVSGSGVVTIDTGLARSGSRSFRADNGASNGLASMFANPTGALDRRWFATYWLYVPSATGLPATDTYVATIWDAPFAAAIASVALTTTGKIQLWQSVVANPGHAQIGSDSSGTVGTDAWHRIDLAVETSSGGSDFAECRLDGVTVASGSFGQSDQAPGWFVLGITNAIGAQRVIRFDDLILNDEQGSANTTWAEDEEHVALLLPTADSARDAGWVGGGGGTTSLFEAVDNIPPAGLSVASATNTSQIENAVSTTTQEYDATMQTYTAAGVVGTVTAIMPVIEGANSSTTGTDTIGVSVESNPVIAETTPSIDVVAGTYPSGWLRGQGTIVEDPAVTLGTAPVMSLRKNIASTRVSSVCFMGLYVSYVEAGDVTIEATAGNLSLGSTTGTVAASVDIAAAVGNLSLGSTSGAASASVAVAATAGNLTLGATTGTAATGATVPATAGALALDAAAHVAGEGYDVAGTVGDFALDATAHTAAAGVAVAATAGDATLDGTSAGVAAGVGVAAAAGNLGLDAASHAAGVGYEASGTVGDLALNATDATATVGTAVSATVGNLALDGSAATAQADATALAVAGDLALDATVHGLSVAQLLTVTAGDLGLDQRVHTASAGAGIAAVLGDLALDGATHGVFFGTVLPATTGDLLLDTAIGTVSADVALSALAGAMTLDATTHTILAFVPPAEGTLAARLLADPVLAARIGARPALAAKIEAVWALDAMLAAAPVLDARLVVAHLIGATMEVRQ